MTKYKIVIVDDEPVICRTVKQLLERNGKYEVSCATNGRDGLLLILTTLPDLVLLDVHMEMSGLEILKTLKEDSATSRIPVVILSGAYVTDAMHETLESYAEAFMLKPVTGRMLEAKLSSILSRHCLRKVG